MPDERHFFQHDRLILARNKLTCLFLRPVKVYYNLSEFTQPTNSVVTIGTFDGVHLGHQKILKRLVSEAKALQGESVLLTFYPHPRMVLFPERKQLLLSTLDEKIYLLRQQGIDHLIIQPFTREFSMMTYEEFVREILVRQLAVKKLVIGYDHQFGRNREGSFENLRKMAPEIGFEVDEISAKLIDDNVISSTKVREALEAGRVEEANALLGYQYAISGTVVKGRQLGRTIGFPTANVVVSDTFKLIPSNGVYAVQVLHNDKVYQGVMNIGVRPTVDGVSRTNEVHIMDFNSDIYGESLKVNFVQRIRDEVKFDSLHALKSQIKKDEQMARSLLSN